MIGFDIPIVCHISRRYPRTVGRSRRPTGPGGRPPGPGRPRHRRSQHPGRPACAPSVVAPTALTGRRERPCPPRPSRPARRASRGRRHHPRRAPRPPPPRTSLPLSHHVAPVEPLGAPARRPRPDALPARHPSRVAAFSTRGDLSRTPPPAHPARSRSAWRRRPHRPAVSRRVRAALPRPDQPSGPAAAPGPRPTAGPARARSARPAAGRSRAGRAARPRGYRAGSVGCRARAGGCRARAGGCRAGSGGSGAGSSR